jgi:hypothetical protein
LTFPLMVLLLLQKSAKGMQLVVNEFCRKLKLPLVTSSAVSQARGHLKHTAFIELNQQAIVGVCYEDGAYERWQGHRLIGVDGSKIALPRTAAIIEHFGGSPANQHSADIEPTAVASIWYDVLNEIVIDSVLAPAKAYEGDLALDHLAHTQPGDVVVFDRNYIGYVWLASLLARQVEFVGRCSRGSFPAVQAMFGADAPPSRLVTLQVPQPQRRRVRLAGLPEQITVRLVRLVLSTGEIEVLISSLLDETRYPTAEFGPLYFQRWGCETCYDRLKNRLLLENFTGTSVEAVKQDFYATIFICGLESLLTHEANDRLQAKSADNRYRQQVNHAVAFNAIKNHVNDLSYTQPDEAQLIDELTLLILTKPVTIRPNRSVPRPKPKSKPFRALRFHKRFKKISF